MSRQRASLFKLATVAVFLGSMMRWGKRVKGEDRNQGYGNPVYSPKKGKRKGYQKITGRKKGFHKFKKH